MVKTGKYLLSINNFTRSLVKKCFIQAGKYATTESLVYPAGGRVEKIARGG
jgi:hypothetical protein